MEERLTRVEMNATTALVRIESHEKECARRYEDWKESSNALKASIADLNKYMWMAMGVLTAVTTVITLGSKLFFK